MSSFYRPALPPLATHECCDWPLLRLHYYTQASRKLVNALTRDLPASILASPIPEMCSCLRGASYSYFPPCFFVLIHHRYGFHITRKHQRRIHGSAVWMICKALGLRESQRKAGAIILLYFVRKALVRRQGTGRGKVLAIFCNRWLPLFDSLDGFFSHQTDSNTHVRHVFPSFQIANNKKDLTFSFPVQSRRKK